MHVPVFVSYAGHPELDVFAASYLVERLAAHGIRSTSFASDASLSLEGILVSAGEQALYASAGETLVSLEVAVEMSLVDGTGWRCEIPPSRGSTAIPIVFGPQSETDRLGALQIALIDAIDARMMDVLFCIGEAGEAETP